MIYLDNAATTKMSSSAINAYSLACEECWGNVSSQHNFGKASNKLLDRAINIICNIINCKSNELIFTSGATEGNNMIINCIKHYVGRDDVVVTSKMEHDSILNPLSYTIIKGNIVYIKPNEYGIIDPDEVEKVIKLYNVKFVSIQMVNNEIGVIQQIKKIAKICHDNNVLFHTDATQALGHLYIDVKDLDVDFLTASAHKFNGPKGVGFIYIKDKEKNDTSKFLSYNDFSLTPLMYGGHQQNNRRAGTIDLPGIYSMAMALLDNNESINENSNTCAIMRNYIINKLKKYKTFQINGSLKLSDRMTNNLSFYIEDVDADIILNILNKYQIYASTGSACNLGYNEFSNTLLSMNKTKWVAKNSIRFTFDPKVNDMVQIKFVVDVLKSILK